jgi:hypothetical protein
MQTPKDSNPTVSGISVWKYVTEGDRAAYCTSSGPVYL